MTKQVFTANQVLTAAQMNSLQNNDFNWDTSTKTVSYVLLAADAGTRVIMNSASNTTITVNTGLFAAGDVLWIHNINTGTCTVTAGTATVNSAGSLALAQWEGGALYFTSASSAIFFRAGGIGYGVATGGSSASRTIGGVNYTVLTFSSDDNLVVSRGGLFDVLLLGGGGGGGGSQTSALAGGGGGAGALVGLASTTTIYIAAGTYSVDVGAGGAGISSIGDASGAASYIGSIISAAGGGGGGTSSNNAAGYVGTNGGSGGGSAENARNGISVDETFGNDGGLGSGNLTAGGGGGGYSSAGGNQSSNTTGGSGGNGVDVSSWGTSASTDNVAAGGGGGASTTGGTAGTGGVAGKTSGAGNNATTAGSGGGGTYGAATTGGNGAAGKVWVRFKQ